MLPVCLPAAARLYCNINSPSLHSLIPNNGFITEASLNHLFHFALTRKFAYHHSIQLESIGSRIDMHKHAQAVFQSVGKQTDATERFNQAGGYTAGVVIRKISLTRKSLYTVSQKTTLLWLAITSTFINRF